MTSEYIITNFIMVNKEFSFKLSFIFFILAVISNGAGLLIDIINYENTAIGNINLISVAISFSLVFILGIFIIFILNKYDLYPKVIIFLMAYITFPALLISSKDGGFIYFLNLISSTFGLVSYLDKNLGKFGFFPIILYDFLIWLKIKYQINIENVEFYIVNSTRILVGTTVSYLFTYVITYTSFRKLYEVNKELREHAHKDQLTGAYNRYYLYDQDLTNCGIIMIDIDNFKKLNDEFGHSNGDASLKSLYRILREILRKDDKIVRYGGEEFIIILKNLTLKYDLYKVAEAVRINVLNKTKDDASIKKQFSISVGAVLYDNKLTLDQNIKVVDSLLYCSKHSGKNKTSISD